MAQKMSEEAIKATRLAGGKRLAAARQGVGRDKYYTIDEAVKLLKGRATAKFDETVEVSASVTGEIKATSAVCVMTTLSVVSVAV